MPLFQQSVLKKYLSDIDQTHLQNAWQLYQQHFFNSDIQENIRNSKEEEYQEGFVRDLFVTVLGYTLNPQPGFNFVLEKKTIADATKSDGAILSGTEVTAVVELKDTGTPDLDKVSTQAFGYKNKHKNCIYVITSNFEKLRFYINDATDYEEFNLFALTEERFSLLYICLQKQNLLANIPQQVKQQSLVQEENVTKKLYADYSLFKRMLFQNIAAQNPQYDKLLLFKKTQKLLDRLLFILFAEDRLLVPPNSVREILKQWEQLKDMDNYVLLYERFKKYFGYLNVGHAGKHHEIFAYNGGLFLPDDVLDIISIDDTILFEGTTKLSNYDFNTEVDVNILGHIFEHSLTEIEELQLELEGKVIEKSKTKRKKEGVFYTPRYITKYIVENTVGALCTFKKEELQINEEAFAPQKRKDHRKKLLVKIDVYRQWLLRLTICDPACGSGAFLNAALEYLKAEHRTVDELKARIFGDAIVYTDIDNEILEHNLFGVDINEDAIEIAKLSLWLHTAKKGRKLSNLSNNIKVGNSLIDDKAVAGNKAFNWQEEFKNVFDNGGFDVVIGNPPYGGQLSDSSKLFLLSTYKSFESNQDIYSVFYEKALFVSSRYGKIGLITPVSWQTGERYFQLRKLLKDNSQIDIAIKLPYDVFEDAYVDTGLYFLSKRNNNNYTSLVYDFPVRFKLTDLTNQTVFKFLLNSDWEQNLDLKFITSSGFYEIISKVKTGSISLSEISKSIRGILANKEDISDDEIIDYKKMFVGDIYRYEMNPSFKWVKFGPNLKEKPNDYSWFQSDRILIRRLINRQFRIMAFYTDEEFVNKKDLYILKLNSKETNIKYILALINCTLFSFLKTKGSTTASKDDFSQLTLSDIRELPIKNISMEQQQPFIIKSDIILEKAKELKLLSEQFIKLLKAKFLTININNILQQWHSLTANDFLKELAKQKIKLALFQQQEWLQYFEEQKTKANNIQQVIQQTDKEIDAMVYNLYELSDQEIAIVEESHLA